MRRSLEVVPLPAPLLQNYRDGGYITGRHVNSLLPRAAQRRPWLPAVTQGTTTLTYAQLDAEVARVVARLQSARVDPGDVVVWQTPNWWESVVIAIAIWSVGAISAPVVTFYRRNELAHILSQLRPDFVVTVAEHRGFAHSEMFDDILGEIGVMPKAKLLLRGTAPGWTSYDELPAAPTQPPARATAEDPCLILYTSGTTAKAKGVIHSSRSLLAATQVIAEEWGFGWQDTGYMAAPLQHVTGILLGLTVPLLGGGHSVLAEQWDPARAVNDIIERQATYAAGATLFLEELVSAAQAAQVGSLPLRVFCCGGAPIPMSLVGRADELGIPACRVYGMTELPAASIGHPTAPLARRAGTDGAIAPGVEVVAVDDTGTALPLAEPGELLVRGPALMSGYVDPADNQRIFGADGWFRTGDIGLITAEGDVLITGRIKDIVNRAGEKFSTREIEDQLLTHRSVLRVAVVPAPDPRFGEVPAAFVVVDGEFDQQALHDHLIAAGLPNQKTPVHWRALADLPTTPSGKVMKFELAARLRIELGSAKEPV
jgi:acyl-CoA synthetase (AMP-forming)/AMP-acid ligase II